VTRVIREGGDIAGRGGHCKEWGMGGWTGLEVLISTVDTV
jgi:hypothetical protein